MFMGYMITIIAEMLLVVDSLIWLLYFVVKRDNGKTVNMGGYFWIIVFVGGILSTFLMIRSVYTHNDRLVIAFEALIWICIMLTLKRLRKVIIYDDKGFILRKKPFLRQYYGYHEITAVCRREVDTTIYIEKKYIKLNHIMANEAEFLDYTLWNYRRIYGENPPADHTEFTADIFNGHVNNIAEAVFFYVFLSLFIFGIPVYLLYDAHKITTEEETEYLELRVTDYKITENGIMMISDDYKDYFFLGSYKNYGNRINEMLEAVEDKRVLYVNVVYSNIRGDTSYTIFNIEDENGKVYVSFDEVNKSRMENGVKAFPLEMLFSGICFLWVIKSIMVTKNPEKYSQWTRDIFYLNI